MARRLDAADVVQDIFVLAMCRLSDYLKGCAIPFPAWLHAIAVERLIDLYRMHVRARKRSVYRETEQDQFHELQSSTSRVGPCSSPDERPNSEFERQELYERVRTLENDLPQCDQDLLRLRIVEERPIDEVAALLGINRGAVRVRQFRVLRRLRERLDAELLVKAMR